MKINEKLIQTLETHNIAVNTGLMCLLGIYFNINYEKLYDSCPLIQTTIAQLNSCGIYEYQMVEDAVIWHIPLFDDQAVTDDWEWLHDYQNLFRNVRKDCAGTFINVKKKMMKFFQDHPTVRVEDIMEATTMYIKQVNDPRYLQRADYFIKKLGPISQSRLEEYLEIIKTAPKNDYKMM